MFHILPKKLAFRSRLHQMNNRYRYIMLFNEYYVLQECAVVTISDPSIERM